MTGRGGQQEGSRNWKPPSQIPSTVRKQRTGCRASYRRPLISSGEAVCPSGSPAFLSWGPIVRMHEPVGDVSHSDNRAFPFFSYILLLPQVILKILQFLCVFHAHPVDVIL